MKNFILAIAAAVLFSMSAAAQVRFGALENNNTWVGTQTFNEAVIGTGSGNDLLRFTAEGTNPTCNAGDYFVWANSSDLKLKKCENGSISDLAGASTGYQTIQDEGSPLTQETTLNFTGAGVSCAADTGKTTCTITSGSGGDSITVNGSTVTDADFDDADPAAAGSGVNIIWQLNTTPSPDSISAYVQEASASQGGIVTTGAQAFAGAKDFAEINEVVKCDQSAGADAGAKIIACIGSLPSTGGVADARGLEGTQSLGSTSISLGSGTKPVTLLLGAGTYSLTSTAQFLAFHGCQIIGLGPESTHIDYAGTGAAIESNSPTTVNGVDHCTFRDFHLTRSGAVGSTIGINMRGIWKSRVENIYIDNYATGIDLNGTTSGTYLNVIHDNEIINGSVGINLTGGASHSANSNTISDNRITGMTTAGIQGASGNVVQGNTLLRNDIEEPGIDGTYYAIDYQGDNSVLINNWTESLTDNAADDYTAIRLRGGGNLLLNNKYGMVDGGPGVVTQLDKDDTLVNSYIEQSTGGNPIQQFATNIKVNHTQPEFYFRESDTTNQDWKLSVQGGVFAIQRVQDDESTIDSQLSIEQGTGVVISGGILRSGAGTPADAQWLRQGNNEFQAWRNVGDTANCTWGVNTVDMFSIGNCGFAVSGTSSTTQYRADILSSTLANGLVFRAGISGVANALVVRQGASSEVEVIVDTVDSTGLTIFQGGPVRIDGVNLDFENGAAEGYPLLAQSTTPPSTDCDAAGEAGRLYFDTDLDTDGSVVVCTGAGGWKDIDDDGGAGGFTSFDIAADSGTPETVNDAETATFTGGAGIATSVAATNTVTFVTASQEASFLADGGVTSLTCGASNQGKMQVMDDGSLEYCDGATTSVLRTLSEGGGGGDSVRVEDGDNLGTFTDIDTTASFEDQGDINFVFTDGGAGGPDVITALVRPDSVALTTDTTGNYMVDLTFGAGIGGSHTPAEGSTATITTASGETDFLASGALTCGASAQGRMQVHTTPLQYCDNAATPVLQYAAYGASDGDALAGDTIVGFFPGFTVAQLATELTDEDFTPGSETSAESVIDLADLQEKDIDSLTGQANWGTAATKETADLIINGVEVDYEAGAAEGFPRLAQSTTPPSTACDAAAEAGRLYFDTDLDTNGSVMVCTGAGGWKDIDDDGGAGGFTSFDLAADSGTPETVNDAETVTISGGAGIATSVAATNTVTVATASSEADFLASGALTCGASTQGKMQVHTTPLQYCDNAATPALQYAAYGDSSGNAITGDSLVGFFSGGFTSANLRGELTDENGTGVDLFDSATSPTFITSVQQSGDPGDVGFLRTINGTTGGWCAEDSPTGTEICQWAEADHWFFGRGDGTKQVKFGTDPNSDVDWRFGQTEGSGASDPLGYEDLWIHDNFSVSVADNVHQYAGRFTKVLADSNSGSYGGVHGTCGKGTVGGVTGNAAECVGVQGEVDFSSTSTGANLMYAFESIITTGNVDGTANGTVSYAAFNMQDYLLDTSFTISDVKGIKGGDMNCNFSDGDCTFIYSPNQATPAGTLRQILMQGDATEVMAEFENDTTPSNDSFADSPEMIFTAVYDSDDTAGVTRAEEQWSIYANATADGTSSVDSQWQWGVNGTPVASLSDIGVFNGAAFQTNGTASSSSYRFDAIPTSLANGLVFRAGVNAVANGITVVQDGSSNVLIALDPGTASGSVTVSNGDLIINGVEADFESGASEGYPRLAQSTTPPAAACDAAAEAGRLYFDTDQDTNGSVMVCLGASGWKDIDDDGGAGGFTSFDIAADSGTPETVDDAETATFTGGAGISTSVAATNTVTFATASGEADFLSSGALTCGASTQGKIQVHTTPLQYCDNAATPALQYAAYGASDGDALAGDAFAGFFPAFTSADLRTALSDDIGTGAAMFGLISTMSDDLGCTGLQVVRRNAGDTGFECATISGGGAPTTATYIVQSADATLTAEQVAVGGAGIAISFAGGDGGNATWATASQEATFLADGGATSLTCGASNQGKMQVMDDGTLEWCDGATTSVLQTSALGDGAGAALSGDTATAFFSAGTVEAARLPNLSGLNGTLAAGQYGAATIDGDDINSNIAGTGLTLTAGTPDTLDCDSPSQTAVGCLEIATTAETDTGTDATRAVSPDGLSGSIYGHKYAPIIVVGFTTALTTGDGKIYFPIPADFDGMNLVGVEADVRVVSSSGAVNVDLAICSATATGNMCSGTVGDMLSTNLTIDANESKSETAATAAVIDTAQDDLNTGEYIRIDVDGAGTSVQGLVVTLEMATP